MPTKKGRVIQKITKIEKVDVATHRRVIDHMNNREEKLLDQIEELEMKIAMRDEVIDAILEADVNKLVEYQLEHFMSKRHEGYTREE